MTPVDAVGLPRQLPGAASLPDIVFRKVAWRLVPFLCLLYILNILDRVNVGFAAVSMVPDLQMSDAAFNLGFGLFYVGYLLFEVPSNLLLRRVGARRWIGRIMVTWGLVSCATLAVTGTWSFYCIRILLGVAEAGFFPGIVLYLTYWFPARQRARVMAMFMAANALAGVVGNPINGAIMQNLDGVAGLRDWQWLFLLEGIPSILLGFIVLLVLTDRPEQAPWLTPHERDWLVGQMQQEEQIQQLVRGHRTNLLAAVLDARVWLLICVYFTVAVGANAGGAYFPRLLKVQFPGWSKFQLGLLTALPSVCAVVSMVTLGRHSDQKRERRLHLAAAALLACLGWGVAAVVSSTSASAAPHGPWLFLGGLCLAQAGMMSMLPIFWAVPPSFLSGVAAAGGIALINSVANLGGLLGPTILGQFGLWSMAGILFAGSILALAIQPDPALGRGRPGQQAQNTVPEEEHRVSLPEHRMRP